MVNGCAAAKDLGSEKARRREEKIGAAALSKQGMMGAAGVVNSFFAPSRLL
jgi:hypothetical protein